MGIFTGKLLGKQTKPCETNAQILKCSGCELKCNEKSRWNDTAVLLCYRNIQNNCGPPKCECLPDFARNVEGNCIRKESCPEIEYMHPAAKFHLEKGKN